MPEGFQSSDAELREFAAALQATAEKLSSSANKVRGVSYGVSTWGIMPVGQIARKIAKDGTDAAGGDLERASGAVRDAGSGVTNTADLYEEVDSFIAEHHFGGGK